MSLDQHDKDHKYESRQWNHGNDGEQRDRSVAYVHGEDGVPGLLVDVGLDLVLNGALADQFDDLVGVGHVPLQAHLRQNGRVAE